MYVGETEGANVVGSNVGSGVKHKSSGGIADTLHTVSLIQSYAVDTLEYTPGNILAQPIPHETEVH